MNNPTAKQEITNLLSKVSQPSRKQYPVAKHQIATLTELSLIDLMPLGFGYTDAAVIIEAAQDVETSIFNQSGEGESVPASKMNKLVNKVEQETVLANRHEIEIYENTDMSVIETGLHLNNIDYEIENGYLFVEPSQLSESVAVINALGFETDEDER